MLILLLTSCGNKSLRNTAEYLFDGMISGNTNEVVRDVCINHEMLLSDSTTDEFGIRKTIFSKMSYEINEINEEDEKGTIKIKIKTIDVASILSLINDKLKDDEEYLELTGEDKNKYYLKEERDVISSIEDDKYFRTVEMELEAKKINNKWKIVVSDELIYAISGMRY